MIFYHVITKFHLLEAITHKEIYHSCDKVILVIADFLFEDMENLQDNNSEYNWFNDILVFDYKRLKFDSDSVKQAEDMFDSLISPYFETENMFYILGYQYLFTHILRKRKIKYDVFEEASGLFSRPQILEENVKKSNFNMYQMCNELNLFSCDKEFVNYIWLDFDNQSSMLFDSNMRDFSLPIKLGELKENANEKSEGLRKLFGVLPFNMSDSDAILLTQHFMNLRILSYDEQKKMYKTFLDEFLGGEKVLIKKHPSDLMDYGDIRNVSILPGNYPIELIGNVDICLPFNVATISSTAIKTIGNLFTNRIELNNTYLKSYNFAEKYIVLADLLHSLKGQFEFSSVHLYGVDERHLKYLLFCRYQEEINDGCIFTGDVESNIVNIFDDFADVENTVNESHENAVYIFVNSLKQYSFFKGDNREFFLELLPIEITTNSGTSLFGVREEIIYVWTKREDVMDAISEYYFTEHMERMDKDISVSKFSEVEIQIKVLEGLLEATEKRLKEEIEFKGSER